MVINTAAEAIDAWKSLGDWEYADREAAWRWMFEQGRKAAAEDTERLEWLMRNVSGAEFRRLGVRYGGNCGRDRIDAAMLTPNVKVRGAPLKEAQRSRRTRFKSQPAKPHQGGASL